MLMAAEVQLIGVLVLVFSPLHLCLLAFLAQLGNNPRVLCLKAKSLADAVPLHFLKLYDLSNLFLPKYLPWHIAEHKTMCQYVLQTQDEEIFLEQKYCTYF